MWYRKKFDELTTGELFEIYRLRCRVFIVEQQCAYPDIDDIDLTAIHIFRRDNEITAYARVYQDRDAIRIGRVVVQRELRGSGLGKELMARCLTIALSYNKAVKLSAQHYLDRFYRQIGFEATSQVYLEDGIPHQDMVYRGPTVGINETELPKGGNNGKPKKEYD